MSYGIAIGDDGEAYAVGVSGYSQIGEETELAGKRAALNAKKARIAKHKQALKQKHLMRQGATAQAKSDKKKRAERKKNDRLHAALKLDKRAQKSSFRRLRGMGDALAGFGLPGEQYVSNFAGTDFGSALASSESGHFGADMMLGASVSKVVGDKLEQLISKVIERRARIEAGDKAFFARMKALPASDAKKKQIDAYMAMVKKRDAGPTQKLYNQFAAGVITAAESVSAARGAKLKQLFDNPWMVLQKAKTGQAALKTLAGDEEMGLVPVLVGIGVAGAAAGAGTTYLTNTSGDLSAADKEIKALEDSIAKDKKLLESKAIPESAKAELVKTIAAKEASVLKQKEQTTEARIEVAKEKAAAGPLGLGGIASNLKWVVIFGATAALAFMFLPQIKAMLAKKGA